MAAQLKNLPNHHSSAPHRCKRANASALILHVKECRPHNCIQQRGLQAEGRSPHDGQPLRPQGVLGSTLNSAASNPTEAVATSNSTSLTNQASAALDDSIAANVSGIQDAMGSGCRHTQH